MALCCEYVAEAGDMKAGQEGSSQTVVAGAICVGVIHMDILLSIMLHQGMSAFPPYCHWLPAFRHGLGVRVVNSRQSFP
jgi:hypothetical protein